MSGHGELKFADKKLMVVDVQKYGDRIVHYLAQPIDPTVDLSRERSTGNAGRT